MSVFLTLKSMRNILQLNGNQNNVLFKLQLISSTFQPKFTFRSTVQSFKKCRPDSSRPELWYTDYPISLIGKRQSPINIVTKDCILNNRDLQLEPLVIEYPKHFNGLVLKNPRDDKFYGWRVDVLNETLKGGLSGGPLDHNYRLAQFHCHWGKTCGCGSEHTIDGNYYSAELHFVHWNTDLYSTPNEALHSPNGLSVIAVFLESCEEPNEELNKITKLMSEIKFKGERTSVKHPMDILGLFPKQRQYWTYSGSLTTPPLWETVTWIIFKDPVLCTEEQIETFRQLSYVQKCVDGGLGGHGSDCDMNIEENYRTQQPLNERPIIFVNAKH